MIGTNLSCVTAHDKQWQQDASSSGRQRFKEDTDNILVVTAASVTSSSISRTSLNKICEIGLHHSKAAPTFYPPALGCLYCSRMHFFPFTPCWLSHTSTYKPLKAKSFLGLFFPFLRQTDLLDKNKCPLLMSLVVWEGWMSPFPYYSSVLTEVPMTTEFWFVFLLKETIDRTSDKHVMHHSACLVQCNCLQSQTLTN